MASLLSPLAVSMHFHFVVSLLISFMFSGSISIVSTFPIPLPTPISIPTSIELQLNSSTGQSTTGTSYYTDRTLSHPTTNREEEGISERKVVVVLTNVKRQIGNSSPNPISNLHEKVNGQGERGGGQGLNVTDASSSLEFSTTTGKKMVEVPPIQNPILVEPTSVSLSSSETFIGSMVEVRRRSLSLLSPLPFVQASRKSFLFKDVPQKNEQIDMNYFPNVNFTRTANKTFAIRKGRRDRAVIDGGGGSGNSDVDVDRTLIRNRHSSDIISNSVNDDLHNKRKNNSGRLGSGRIRRIELEEGSSSSRSEGRGNDSNKDRITLLPSGTIGTKGIDDLKGQGKSCPIVIVNQTLSLNYTITDMDKWTRTLVKITQCVANCLQKAFSSPWYNKYNMSPKKDMNRVGGGSSFSHGISPPRLQLPSSNNEDIVNHPYFAYEKKNHLNDKLLSSCQKKCKFYPKRKPTFPSSPEMTAISKKNPAFGVKTNSAEHKDSLKTSSKNPIPKPIPIAVKADDSSLGLEITRNDTTGVFHLRWPKLELSTPNKKMFILYTVIGQEEEDYDDHDEDGKGQDVGRWKLIDQTVAPQTQISLVANVCQNLGPYRNIKPSGHQHQRQHKSNPQYLNHHKIRVLVVSSEGLQKLFSGVLISSPCCQQEVRSDHSEKLNTENGQRQPSTLFNVTNENSNKTRPQIQHQRAHASQSSWKDLDDMERVKSLEKLSPVMIGMNKLKAQSAKSHNSHRKEESFESKPPLSSLSSPLPPVQNSWALRTVSMVYQNYLVVTEVSWDFPGEPSNRRVSAEDDFDHSVSVSFNPKNETETAKTQQKYNFLLTWEIFGGGLRGNLVTDTTSGTISLWPDTAYFIQVGLINTENPDLSLSPSTAPSSSSKTNNLGNEVKEQNDGNLLEKPKNPNDMNNPEEMESIIFPLLSEDGEPKVIAKSERLLVNTSQISIPRPSSSSSSPSAKSQRSYRYSQSRSVSRSSSSRNSKSNNPLLPQEEGDPEKSFYLPKTNVSSILSPSTSASTSSVSINGNENDHHNRKADYSLRGKDATDASISKNGQIHSGSESHHQYQRTLKKDRNHYHHYEGYLGDSPLLKEGSVGYGYYDEKAVHSYHNSLRKELTQAQPTLGTNGFQDKKNNINDNNKSNNNLKPRTGTDQHRDHERDHHPAYGFGNIFRPDVYQDLFALHFGNSHSDVSGRRKTEGPSALTTGSEHSNSDSNNNNNNNIQFDFSNKNDTSATSAGLGFDLVDDDAQRPSPVYSVFVLIIVACVIFLFLVAFIGFFVVTSSIAKTAQYFVPKRVRIWVVGGDTNGGQSGLFGGDEEGLVEEEDDDDDEEEDELGNHHQAIMGELEDIEERHNSHNHGTNGSSSNWNGIAMNASLSPFQG